MNFFYDGILHALKIKSKIENVLEIDFKKSVKPSNILTRLFTISSLYII